MEKIKIVEVGPRDGLQNEPTVLTMSQKVAFINALSQTGLTTIEAGSMVSPKWVPQLADSEEVFQHIHHIKNIHYPVLVPNLHGLQRALNAGVTEISVFTAASETFSKKNTNCSITESLNRIQAICNRANELNIKVRGYVSCVLGCPYEGEIQSSTVIQIAEKLTEFGCYEISLGDTIGVGTTKSVTKLIHQATKSMPTSQLAVHFHDTYGQALVNIYAALEQGIRVVDSAVAGLGGCPYAKGASGNVATEDVVYMLNGLGLDSGVNLQQLVAVGQNICMQLNRQPTSKVNLALANKI